jgi:hypothetical protein
VLRGAAVYKHSKPSRNARMRGLNIFDHAPGAWNGEHEISRDLLKSTTNNAADDVLDLVQRVLRRLA